MHWILARQAVLWLGLLLCGYALWHAHALAGDAIDRLNPSGWALIGTLLFASWGFTVAAWRRYLLAYTAHDPGWRVAIRQLGLLLVGKYVPGGVFGFLARLYDQPSAPRRQLVWAGVVEQVVGVGLLVALGGVLLLVAKTQSLAWLSVAFLLPFIAIAGIWTLHKTSLWLPVLRSYVGPAASPLWQTLLSAIVLHFAQLIAWLVLIVLLVGELYHLQNYAALGVAGAFLFAVGAGMLIVPVPGGIGVREAVLVGLSSYWLDMPQAVFLAAMLRLVSVVLDAAAGAIAAMSGLHRGAST